MKRTIALFLLLTSVCFAQRFDLIISNGHIIDGTGSPWYSGDIGIRGGRHRGDRQSRTARRRKRTIDAHGMVVAPGFIDMLGQSELTILVDPRLPSKIYQGITTEITGEGGSAAPLNDAIIQADQPGYEHYKHHARLADLRQYFARLEKQGIGINLASYVGATQVRRMVLGDDDVQPTPAQLEQMKSWCAMRCSEGAVGVSTSLRIRSRALRQDRGTDRARRRRPRSSAASTPRTCATKAIAVLEAHRRSGAHRHARRKIPVEIWHLKVAGKAELGTHARDGRPDQRRPRRRRRRHRRHLRLSRMVQQLFRLHSAVGARRRRRQNDRAPEGPATRARIRKDMLDPGEDWDNEWQEIPGPEAILIGVVQNPKLLPLQGKRLSEVAKIWNKDPMDALFDFLIEDNGVHQRRRLRHVGA